MSGTGSPPTGGVLQTQNEFGLSLQTAPLQESRWQERMEKDIVTGVDTDLGRTRTSGQKFLNSALQPSSSVLEKSVWTASATCPRNFWPSRIAIQNNSGDLISGGGGVLAPLEHPVHVSLSPSVRAPLKWQQLVPTQLSLTILWGPELWEQKLGFWNLFPGSSISHLLRESEVCGLFSSTASLFCVLSQTTQELVYL